MNFRLGLWHSHPKFRKSLKKNREGGRILPWKILGFPEIFACTKQKSLFWKICRFSCNTGQFFSVHGNLLLLVGGDSFLILPGVECSSIRWLVIYSQNIAYFADFWQNNSTYLLKLTVDLKNINCGKSSYSGKNIFIKITNFQSIYSKEKNHALQEIANFINLRQNGSIFIQNIVHLK